MESGDIATSWQLAGVKPAGMGKPTESQPSPIFFVKRGMVLCALPVLLVACGPDDRGEDEEDPEMTSEIAAQEIPADAAVAEPRTPRTGAGDGDSAAKLAAEVRARKAGRLQARENEFIRNERYKARKLARRLEQHLAQQRADSARRGQPAAITPPPTSHRPLAAAAGRTWVVHAPTKPDWRPPQKVAIRPTALDHRGDSARTAARAAEASAEALREEELSAAGRTQR